MTLHESSVPDLQILMTGLAFGESPRWHEDRLWFSNWGMQEVVAVDLEGKNEVILRMPSFPFSIDWLPDGRLLITWGGDVWQTVDLDRGCFACMLGGGRQENAVPDGR